MGSRYIKSPLNYMGGKYKTLGRIMPIIEKNPTGTFVDLFAGGFNVGINSEAEVIVCNDQIGFLIDMYQRFTETPFEDLRSLINQIIDEFALSKTNADGYRRLRSRYNDEKSILDLFVLSCYSFNHQIRFNSKHEFNTPFGKNRSAYNKSIENNLEQFCEALARKNIAFSCKDFREVDFSQCSRNDLVYCDPPYLISTGTYNDGKRGYSGWSLTDEKDLLGLLSALDERGIRFALSNAFYNKGLSNDLLIEWASSFNVHYVDNSFTNCSYHYRNRDAKTIEVLVTNY